jgi:hypothetical protein
VRLVGFLAFPGVVLEGANVQRVAGIPAEDAAPGVVDPDRPEGPEIDPERHKPDSGKSAEVRDTCGSEAIELAERRPDQVWGNRGSRLRLLRNRTV